MDLYFFPSSNNYFYDIGNWFEDTGNSVLHNALPGAGDTAIIRSGYTSQLATSTSLGCSGGNMNTHCVLL